MDRNLEVRYENKPCYDIIIRFNFDDLVENLIKIKPDKAFKICIVTDSNVSKLYLGEVARILRDKFNDVITFEIPAGEENKTLSNVKKLYEVLIRKKFYRGDLLVALGGGVIGDLTGFCAATFLRGIDFVQIPTTLLSQVDSSIGGKTGVDFDEYKNMVGAFHMPRLVYINTSLLNSLPKDQFSSGMAEIIKHGIIRNRAYFNWLKANSERVLSRNPDALSEMIYESCIIKRDVVEEDPKEKGIRAWLNFGHTIGHAIEKCANFTLSHGQCVAYGSVAAAMISEWQNYITSEDLREIEDIFAAYNLETRADIPDPELIFETTKSDKKMTSKGIKFVLIKSIGEAFIETGLADDALKYGIRGISRD